MINTIASKIAKKGGRIFYTGGYVRDFLINKNPADNIDVDIEIFHMQQNQLISILAEFGIPHIVGKNYPIIKIAGYPQWDFAIAPYDDYKQAVLRRDFTVNAIMQDVLSGEILDFVEGQKDMQNRLIQHTQADVFRADPLRVYRAAVLAARLNFTISPQTLKLMQSADISNLPAERIFEELQKLLLMASKPSIGLEYLAQTNILEKNHPELFDLITCPQEEEFHPEGDVWAHTLLVVDEAAKLRDKSSNPAALMWAALLHDIGKPATTKLKNDRLVSYGHDMVGADLAHNFLNKLRASKTLTSEVVRLVKEHMHPLALYRQREKITDKAIRKLVNRVNLMELLLLSEADYSGRPIGRDFVPIREWYINRVEGLGLDPLQKIQPLIKGLDLIEMGLSPNKDFKKILDYAFDLQLEGKSKSEILEKVKAYYN